MPASLFTPNLVSVAAAGAGGFGDGLAVALSEFANERLETFKQIKGIEQAASRVAEYTGNAAGGEILGAYGKSLLMSGGDPMLVQEMMFKLALDDKKRRDQMEIAEMQAGYRDILADRDDRRGIIRDSLRAQRGVSARPHWNPVQMRYEGGAPQGGLPSGGAGIDLRNPLLGTADFGDPDYLPNLDDSVEDPPPGVEMPEGEPPPAIEIDPATREPAPAPAPDDNPLAQARPGTMSQGTQDEVLSAIYERSNSLPEYDIAVSKYAAENLPPSAHAAFKESASKTYERWQSDKQGRENQDMRRAAAEDARERNARSEEQFEIKKEQWAQLADARRNKNASQAKALERKIAAGVRERAGQVSDLMRKSITDMVSVAAINQLIGEYKQARGIDGDAVVRASDAVNWASQADFMKRVGEKEGKEGAAYLEKTGNSVLKTATALLDAEREIALIEPRDLELLDEAARTALTRQITQFKKVFQTYFDRNPEISVGGQDHPGAQTQQATGPSPLRAPAGVRGGR